jgi:cytochrome c oxidase subunit 2
MPLLPRNTTHSSGHRIPWRRLRVPLLIGTALLAAIPSFAVAAVSRPPWHPGDPYSPITQPQSGEVLEISHLFWLTLALSGIVFALVTGAIIISVLRFSARRGDTSEPAQVFGNRRIELLWTLIPTAILGIAFIATVKAMNDINNPKTNTAVFDINAVGHQWWWEFQYPKLGIDTANEVHVPAGSWVRFHVTSYDVIHSFWVPQLQRQIDANPGAGEVNTVYLKAEHPGVFSGDCYEYCGTEHAWMKFKEIVQPAAQFNAWVKHMQAPATAPAGGLIAAGQKVFNSNTCVNCHAIQNASGFSPGGAVGPNLTHLTSRWAAAGGAVPLTQQNLAQWVENPNTYKSGVVMPGYPFLSKKDINALSAYLMSLR